jgi:hypothetical protein
MVIKLSDNDLRRSKHVVGKKLNNPTIKHFNNCSVEGPLNIPLIHDTQIDAEIKIINILAGHVSSMRKTYIFSFVSLNKRIYIFYNTKMAIR